MAVSHSASQRTLSRQSTHSSFSGAESLLSMESEGEITAHLEALVGSNEFLARENATMLQYLLRQDPALAAGLDLNDDPRKGQRKAQRKRNKATGALLTPEQKLEVAQRETDATRIEINRAVRSGEKLLDKLRALKEEAETQVAEIKKDAYEFKREIIIGAENPRTNKIMAERVLKYMDDKLKQKDALIDKLRLKNSMIKQQIRKMKTQLQEKEELGEGLSEIDFEQLQIENSQYVEKIKERNAELMDLKQISGNTTQMLNMFKRKLSTLVSESDWLDKEISLRKEFLEKTLEEAKEVQVDRERCAATNKSLNDRVSATKVPAVLDYVDQKASEYDLDKKVKNYERKVEIAAMELRRLRGMVRSALKSGTS